MVFQTRTEQLAAHRAILGHHSPIFKQMLLGENRGVASIRIDHSTESVKSMLRYLYTGSLGTALQPGGWDIWDELLRLADAYCLPGLKQHVETFLALGIDGERFPHLWQLASSRQCALLHSALVLYFTHSCREVILFSSGWSALVRDSRESTGKLVDIAFPHPPGFPTSSINDRVGLVYTMQLEWGVGRFGSILGVISPLSLWSHEFTLPALPDVKCRMGFSITRKAHGRWDEREARICLELDGLKVYLIVGSGKEGRSLY